MGGEGGDALSGVSPDTESRESGVALLDLVPVLETCKIKKLIVEKRRLTKEKND